MLQVPQPALVLASESVFRKSLLAAAQVIFETQPARIDEMAIKQAAQSENQTAAECALTLAHLKAKRIAAARPDALVIGADQILVCEGRWFDKPRNLAEAETHLRDLMGKTHELVTAMVCYRNGAQIWHHIARPRLTMRVLSEAFLASYLEAEGKMLTQTVGAYRLEGLGVHLFDRIEGEHSAIIGLPLLPLLGFLRQHGVIMG
jgi:septum formation protein